MRRHGRSKELIRLQSEGKTTYEIGMSADFVPVAGQKLESLNGEGPTVATDKFPQVETPYEFSARAYLMIMLSTICLSDISFRMTDTAQDTDRTVII